MPSTFQKWMSENKSLSWKPCGITRRTQECYSNKKLTQTKKQKTFLQNKFTLITQTSIYR